MHSNYQRKIIYRKFLMPDTRAADIQQGYYNNYACIFPINNIAYIS